MVTKYEVVAGDTLSKLAQRFYGDATLFPVIAVPNGITDPDEITVGQELLIPYITERHTVVPGDTLRALAEDHYGNAEMFAMIAAANHVADPNRITVGQVLFFPNLTNF
ncbi:LysM peptidoglycan-binding domain-containing protein [Rhodococcus pyridinivorans]|uniref:LysM peptidoglycan-binding domain-containing protein n=1 Tax=Rhodococcus pyridinivorans TaxID=103816 RepID=UPI0037CB91D5